MPEVTRADILAEIRAVRSDVAEVRTAIDGPAGLNVRVALVEQAVKAGPGRWPDPKWVGGVVGAVLLTLLSAAGLMAATPAQPVVVVTDPCERTCEALGLGDGDVGPDGVCECDGVSLAAHDSGAP